MISWTSSCAMFWEKFGDVDLTIVAPVLATILVAQVLLYARVQQRRTLPPGRRPWPIVGNLFEMSGEPHRSLHQLASKFGGIMYLRLGSVPCIVVSSTEAAQAVFQTNDASFSSRPKGMVFETMSDNYKTCVFADYGPYWRQLRKFCSQELFSSKRHASYGAGREEEICEGMKELWEESHNGEPINLKEWLYGVASNIVTRMLVNKRYFGKGVEQHKQEKKEFMEYLEHSLKAYSAFIISDYVPYLNFVTKLQGWPSICKELREEASKFGKRMLEVEKHRQRAKEMGPDNEHYTPDFVDTISEFLNEDGNPISDRLLTMIVLEILQAGIESASTIVEWAMMELMMNPRLMQQAQDELDDVVGTNRLVQESDIPSLPYLQAVVKEAFRLHPPLPLSVPRESTEATQVLGYSIPARTRLILNVFAIHRDPAAYKDPDVFNPKRFFVDHPEVNHLSAFDSFQLLPFGVGRRICPAYNLGNTMVHLMLANLLHSFSWSLPKGQTMDTSEQFGLVVCKKIPLELIAKHREHIMCPEKSLLGS